MAAYFGSGIVIPRQVWVLHHLLTCEWKPHVLHSKTTSSKNREEIKSIGIVPRSLRTSCVGIATPASSCTQIYTGRVTVHLGRMFYNHFMACRHSHFAFYRRRPFQHVSAVLTLGQNRTPCCMPDSAFPRVADAAGTTFVPTWLLL